MSGTGRMPEGTDQGTDRGLHAPHPLADLMAEHDALRASQGGKVTVEAMMAIVSAQVTREAEEKKAAAQRG